MGAEGTEGSNDKISSLLGVGKGTVNIYICETSKKSNLEPER